MNLLSVLFPKRCVGCGSFNTYLCPDCVNRCIPLAELYCPSCRLPTFLGQTHINCKRKCQLDGLISGYPYQGVIKRTVTKFKYSFATDLHATLIELILSATTHPLLSDQPWTIMPIPLHPKRLKWRGFNQAEILAEGIASNWQWPLEINLLKRIKNTHSQMTLSKHNRQTNLVDAFAVQSKTKDIPKNVLLIDDVATTCTTLNECASVLKKAGVTQVWGFTLAQTIPQNNHSIIKLI